MTPQSTGTSRPRFNHPGGAMLSRLRCTSWYCFRGAQKNVAEHVSSLRLVIFCNDHRMPHAVFHNARAHWVYCRLLFQRCRSLAIYAMRVIWIADLGVHAIHGTIFSLPSVSSCTNCCLVEDIASLRKHHMSYLSISQ